MVAFAALAATAIGGGTAEVREKLNFSNSS
jgi:hypothetical protein